MKARIESYLERKAACVRGRYTVELRREAVELWTEQVSDGVSETDAAKVLGHSCFILRSWRSPRSAQAPAIVPVVIRPTRKKRDKRVLSVEAAGRGHIAIQSPDGWSFAVESPDDAIALVRGLR